ncbi:unnamed protein product [Effrenium voratum]|nr:unnamed protein product [Effrenium voratum]
MGCAASLSAKYLPAPKPEASTSQASTAPAAKIDEKGGETPHPQEPKKWTRMEMGQLTVPQLVRWLEALNADLTAAVPPPRARKRLWQEIQKSPPPALEQVTSLSHLDHWPLPETLRWLEYFDALDEDVAAKDKLIAMLLDFGEDLPPPPNFSETAEANFLTEVQRHVDMVKQAVTAIVTQLSEQLAEADAQERPKHAWYANGKALTDFKPAEIKATEQMDIPFIELKVGDRVDLTLQEGSGWAWIVNEGEQSHGWAPASAVTEFALALQDYAAEEAESLRCQKGEEFEVILRHYSGWTLCRRPKPGEQTPTTLSGDAEEGWLPDTCLSDHPRNMNTKQQHLILAGLHRLASDVAGVESAFYRIQTEGSTEEDSLQTLHAKVCALADEYRSIVAVIQANPQLLGQETLQSRRKKRRHKATLQPWACLPGFEWRATATMSPKRRRSS